MTIYNKDLRKRIEEEDRKIKGMQRMAVKATFKETILREEPLTLKEHPRVRLDMQTIYMQMKEKFIEMGYKPNKDFELELR